MLLFQIKNNKVVAEANPTPEADGSIPKFYRDQGGWVEGYVESSRTLGKFEFFSEEKYKKTAGKWYRYHSVLSISQAEAKAQKKEEMREAFREDILWTDEELQFYQKRKGASDNSYSQWWSAVATYHGEAYTEKQRCKRAMETADSLADLSLISYNPTHVKSKEELQSPYKNK